MSHYFCNITFFSYCGSELADYTTSRSTPSDFVVFSWFGSAVSSLLQHEGSPPPTLGPSMTLEEYVQIPGAPAVMTGVTYSLITGLRVGLTISQRLEISWLVVTINWAVGVLTIGQRLVIRWL